MCLLGLVTALPRCRSLLLTPGTDGSMGQDGRVEGPPDVAGRWSAVRAARRGWAMLHRRSVMLEVQRRRGRRAERAEADGDGR